VATGFDLPRRYPNTGSANNLGAAIVLLNREVQSYLKSGVAERDLLSTEELEAAYRAMDEIVDSVVAQVRKGTKDDA